jgi:hypothetical protein
MITIEEMLATAQQMEGGFSPPGLAWGVDGVIIRFYALSHKVPCGKCGTELLEL